jgi:hypothetical protein
MHRRVLAALAPRSSLARLASTSLHSCCATSRARLVRIDDELVEVLSAQDFIRRGDDRIGELGVEPARFRGGSVRPLS